MCFQSFAYEITKANNHMLYDQRYTKYCNKAYVKSYLRNPAQIRFSRNRYFQMLDSISTDGLIGDINESARTDKISIPWIEGDQSILLPNNQIANIKCEGQGSSIFLAVRQYVDCFIFSLVFNESFRVQSRADAEFCKGIDAYDACVDFYNIDIFLGAIARGWCQIGRISDIFHMNFGLVKYGDVSERVLGKAQMLVSPSPFFKSRKFKDQREFRIVLTPKSPEFLKSYKSENKQIHENFVHVNPIDWITISTVIPNGIVFERHLAKQLGADANKNAIGKKIDPLGLIEIANILLDISICAGPLWKMDKQQRALYDSTIDVETKRFWSIYWNCRNNTPVPELDELLFTGRVGSEDLLGVMRNVYKMFGMPYPWDEIHS